LCSNQALENAKSIPVLLWITVLVVAGYLRWNALGEPQFWYDESITALRVSGHTEREVLTFAESRGVLPLGIYRRFTQYDPARGVGDVVTSLRAEDPQHTPLYYVIAYYWMRIFGSEPSAARGLAVLFSLLALPATFWLGREVFLHTGTFSSSWPVWITVLVSALSPYNISFGREDREYSLWMLSLVLLTAAFMRALRLRRRQDWAIFAASLCLAAYAHMLTWLVCLGLAGYLLLRHAREWRVLGRDFALAALLAGLLFVPWAMVLLAHRAAAQDNLSWVQSQSAGELFAFTRCLAPHFVTGQFALWGVWAQRTEQTYTAVMAAIASYLPYGVLAGLALLYPRSRNGALTLISMLFCSTAIPFFAADFWSGGVLGYVYRYSAPAALAWILALSFLLGCLVEWEGPGKVFTAGLVLAVLAFMGFSAKLENLERYPLPKSPSDHGSVAGYLNLNPGITLLSDEHVGSILSLNFQVRPDLPVRLRPRCASCRRPGQPDFEVPPFDFASKPVYYRSWVNLGNEAISRIQGNLANDRTGDPRYHSRSVEDPEAEFYLFSLSSR